MTGASKPASLGGTFSAAGREERTERDAYVHAPSRSVVAAWSRRMVPLRLLSSSSGGPPTPKRTSADSPRSDFPAPIPTNESSLVADTVQESKKSVQTLSSCAIHRT